MRTLQGHPHSALCPCKGAVREEQASFPGTLSLPEYLRSACSVEAKLDCLQHQQLLPLHRPLVSHLGCIVCQLLSYHTYNLSPMCPHAGQCPLAAVVTSRVFRPLSGISGPCVAAGTAGHTSSLCSSDCCAFCSLMGPDTALMTCPSVLILG